MLARPKACEKKILNYRFSAAIAGCRTRVACSASTLSSNHRPKSDTHNLADRSSLAPATARELLPMVRSFFACLIRWLHTGPRTQAKSGERVLTAGHPAGDDSRTSADVRVPGSCPRLDRSRDHSKQVAEHTVTKCGPSLVRKAPNDYLVRLCSARRYTIWMSHYPGSIILLSQSLLPPAISFVFILDSSAGCALHRADGLRVNPRRAMRKRKPCVVIRSQDVLAPVKAVVTIFHLSSHIELSFAVS
jgi:hypothetical protein